MVPSTKNCPAPAPRWAASTNGSPTSPSYTAATGLSTGSRLAEAPCDHVTTMTGAAITMYEHGLPWKGAYGMLVIAARADGPGTLLDRGVLPIDDPGPAAKSPASPAGHPFFWAPFALIGEGGAGGPS